MPLKMRWLGVTMDTNSQPFMNAKSVNAIPIDFGGHRFS